MEYVSQWSYYLGLQSQNRRLCFTDAFVCLLTQSLCSLEIFALTNNPLLPPQVKLAWKVLMKMFLVNYSMKMFYKLVRVHESCLGLSSQNFCTWKSWNCLTMVCLECFFAGTVFKKKNTMLSSFPEREGERDEVDEKGCSSYSFPPDWETEVGMNYLALDHVITWSQNNLIPGHRIIEN